jgi:hypothetical protein
MQEPVQKVFTPATAVEMMGIHGLTRRVGLVPSLFPGQDRRGLDHRDMRRKA